MGNQLSTWNLTLQSAVRGPKWETTVKEWNTDRIFTDYTWFYIGIGATSLVAALLILFNVCLGCKYKSVMMNDEISIVILVATFIVGASLM